MFVGVSVTCSSEFQDINPLQIQLLEALRGGRDDLCVVGDPRQAIYGWNGSDPAILEQFGERWPGSTIVRLKPNYRSTPQVVAAAEAVLVAGGMAAAGLEAASADGAAVRVHRYADDLEEAAGIVARSRRPRRRWGKPRNQRTTLRCRRRARGSAGTSTRPDRYRTARRSRRAGGTP